MEKILWLKPTYIFQCAYIYTWKTLTLNQTTNPPGPILTGSCFIKIQTLSSTLLSGVPLNQEVYLKPSILEVPKPCSVPTSGSRPSFWCVVKLTREIRLCASNNLLLGVGGGEREHCCPVTITATEAWVVDKHFFSPHPNFQNFGMPASMWATILYGPCLLWSLLAAKFVSCVLTTNEG